MKRKISVQVAVILIIVICIIIIPYFVPQKVVTVNQVVTKITVFDGNTGRQATLTDTSNIDQFIKNFNDITFTMEKPAFFRMGYSFRVTYYQGEKEIKQFIVNNAEQLRYRGFFYISDNRTMPYDYLQSLSFSE